MDKGLKHAVEIVTMWHKKNRVYFGKYITKPLEELLAGLKKCASVRLVTPARIGQNSSKLLWKAFGRIPKILDPSHTV